MGARAARDLSNAGVFVGNAPRLRRIGPQRRKR